MSGINQDMPDENDFVRWFLAEIRNGFMMAGPHPHFGVEMVSLGKYRPSRVKGIVFDVQPHIRQVPVPENYLMSLDFQDRVNKRLAKNPAVLTGITDIEFMDTDRKVVIPHVPWRIEVISILGMHQDAEGTVQITDFKWRGVIDHGYRSDP